MYYRVREREKTDFFLWGWWMKAEKYEGGKIVEWKEGKDWGKEKGCLRDEKRKSERIPIEEKDGENLVKRKTKKQGKEEE